MRRDILIERVYPHAPEELWIAFSTGEAMGRWLMPNTFEPHVGHRFEFRTAPAPGFDGIVRCEVLELIPSRVLAFSWAGGGLDTVVRFEFLPEDGGTRLRLSHTGFDGLKGVLLSVMLGNGWRGMLERKLPLVLQSASGSHRPGGAEACGGETTRFWRVFNRLFHRAVVIAGLAAVLVPAPTGAQAPAASPDALKNMAMSMHDAIAGHLASAAALMPEERYEFRATPEVRSFGQMIAHVAGSQFIYCGAATGARLDAATRQRLGPARSYAEASPPAAAGPVPKDVLVQLLRDGLEFCRTAQTGLAADGLLEPVSLAGRSLPRIQLLMENVAHSNEHYGNLVAYLRLNGLVPPSTAGRK
jgi:uncharacterized protein YndB with AHSA1/START domain